MHFFISCVASVSVWFRSKVRPRNGIFGFGRAKNGTRATFRAVDLETASSSGASVFPKVEANDW